MRSVEEQEPKRSAHDLAKGSTARLSGLLGIEPDVRHHDISKDPSDAKRHSGEPPADAGQIWHAWNM